MSDAAVIDQPVAEAATTNRLTEATDWQGTTLTIRFSNGTNRTFSLEGFAPEMAQDLAMFGLLKRIQQSYAGLKGDVPKAIASADKVYDQLRKGEWGAERGEGTVNVTVQALAALMGLDTKTVQAKWDAKTLADKRAIGKRPDVRAKIAELRASKPVEAPALADVL